MAEAINMVRLVLIDVSAYIIGVWLFLYLKFRYLIS